MNLDPCSTTTRRSPAALGGLGLLTIALGACDSFFFGPEHQGDVLLSLAFSMDASSTRVAAEDAAVFDRLDGARVQIDVDTENIFDDVVPLTPTQEGFAAQVEIDPTAVRGTAMLHARLLIGGRPAFEGKGSLMLPGSPVSTVPIMLERSAPVVDELVRTESGGLIVDLPGTSFPRGASYATRLTGVNMDLIDSIAADHPDVSVNIIRAGWDTAVVTVTSTPVPENATAQAPISAVELDLRRRDGSWTGPQTALHIVPAFRPEVANFAILNEIGSLPLGQETRIELRQDVLTSGNFRNFFIGCGSCRIEWGPLEGERFRRSRTAAIIAVIPPTAGPGFSARMGAIDNAGYGGDGSFFLPVGDGGTSPALFRLDPASEQEYPVGSSIRFRAAATDPQEGTLTGGSLVWTSDIDGHLGTGATIARTDLSGGTHVITITATDTDGNSAELSVRIHVVDP